MDKSEITGYSARNVRPHGRNDMTAALASQSSPMEPSGIVGIADGPGALAEDAIEWAKTRGISRQTLENFGVTSGRGRNSSYITFPHFRDGEIIGRKHRQIPDKDFRCDKGSELRFWNVDAVLGAIHEGSVSEVVVVEGEMDALAVAEAGYPPWQVLSVPNGANQQEAADPFSAHSYFEADFGAGLCQLDRWILWTDPDAPGRALQADLTRMIGPGRCAFVGAPSDANSLLLDQGPDAVAGAIKHATPAPLPGAYTVLEMPEPPEREVWRPGFVEWEDKVGLGRGLVSVVTGHPGHGKSVLSMQILAQIAKNYGVNVAVASLETPPIPDHRRNIRSTLFSKLEKDMADAEKRQADEWNHEHFTWLVHPDGVPSLNWLLDMAEALVVRKGVQILQIDPWNRLDIDRPSSMSETEYILKSLVKVATFAKTMQCHVQIVAHPAKMWRKAGESPSPPYLDDISGSKAWDNVPDQGFVVHRPKMFEEGERRTDCQFYVRKARFPDLGFPCTLDMEYDLSTGRYESVDYREGY